MTAVILTVHVLIVLGLIGVVLLQRSEGGALGMGGAGSGGGFMTGRGAADALTRTTTMLAALFFATSLGLAMIAGQGESEEAVIEELTGEAVPDPAAAPAPLTTDDLLNTLGGDDDAASGANAAAPSEQEILDALGTAPDSPAPDAAPEGETEDPAPDQ